jgi:hypothetical protein
MGQMNRRVTGFSRNAQRSLSGVSSGFRTLRRVAGVALAAMTTGAVARAVTQFAEVGDEVAKMSRELGLGAEALQELRFAADRQGVSTRNLERALGGLNRRVGDLRQGQGSLYSTLSRSNPELAEQLKNAGDTEEAFMLMMEALEGTENAADRAALAQAAFGRSGQTLVRMAEAGSGGLEALRQKARDLGIVMSDEATANAELFQDSLTNLKGAMRGVVTGALVPLIERLQPLIAQMGEWIKANKELINQRIEAVFQGIADASRVVARMWDNGVIPAILAGVVAFKAITGAIAAYQAITAAAKGVQIAFNAVLAANPIYLIIAGVVALVAAIVWMVKNWDKVKDALGVVWDRMKQFAEWIASVFQPIIDRIAGAIETVSGIAQGIGSRIGNVFDGDPETGLFSRGRATNETLSRSESISRSEVDINVGGLPRGSRVQQRGRAPGVSLAYGREGGRL